MQHDSALALLVLVGVEVLAVDCFQLHETMKVSSIHDGGTAVIKLTVKSLVELNLYTESGLAKIAIGVRLEGTAPGISAAARSYSYTAFNRGEPELAHFNEDFVFTVGLNADVLAPTGIHVKFRVVEEGPVTRQTIPFDSRSASPVYEIIPEQQRRSIVAYGRLPLPMPDGVGTETLDKYVRVALHEATSDERCGELAVGLHITTANGQEPRETRGVNGVHETQAQATAMEMEMGPSPAPTPVLANPVATRSDSHLRLLVHEHFGSVSPSPSVHVGDSNVVLNEANVTCDVTDAARDSELDAALERLSVGANVSPEAAGRISEDRMSLLSDASLQDYSDDELDGGESGDGEVSSGEPSTQSPLPPNSLAAASLNSRSSSTASATPSEGLSDVVGMLSLEIVAAQNLPRAKRFMRGAHYEGDPFVTISFGKQSFRTVVCKNTVNPVWRERVAFSIKATEMTYQVMLSVYDHQHLGTNACLATATLRAGHFIQYPDQTLKLAVPLNPYKQSQVQTQEACLLMRGSFLTYERLRQNFWTKLLRAFDLNCNGHLGKLEFEAMLESLGSTLSETTISRVFSAVDSSANQEIAIDEAVKFLEDLTVRASHHSHSGAGDEEKIVILHHCPFCQRQWRPKHGEMDIITHLGICSATDSSQMDRFVMGGFLTEEYASRKWFAKLLSFMSFGNYRIGRNNGNILVQDRRTGKLLEEKMPTYIRLGIRLLHQNVVTYRTAVDFGYVRGIFQSLTIQQGKKFDHPSSVRNIPGFIKYHKLPVHEIADPLTSFRSFNEFFYRKLKLAECRSLACPDDPTVTVSPADCRLNVFGTLSDATRLWIKGVNFSLAGLLKDAPLAQYFSGGSLVVCRLAPQDYHRFHSPVDGRLVMNYHVPGTYYTVNPMAVRQRVDVFTENARTVTVIESPHFGKVAFVSIGAMMVGSIVITAPVGAELRRMDEIGYFAFGGSTIVLLYAASAGVRFDADLVANSGEQLETLIRVGDSLGRTAKE